MVLGHDAPHLERGRLRRLERGDEARLFQEPLAAEWETLAKDVGATPYVRPGWTEAWWRAFGTGRLDVCAVRRQGRLAAVLPVIRRHGAVRSATNYHTPQFSVLATDRSAATEIAETLFATRPRSVTLAPLASADLTMEACRLEAEKAGYQVMVRPFQRSPYLDIDGDWTRYESQLSRSLVGEVRRMRRRLSMIGTVSVQVSDGRTHLDSLLREAFAVETSGWKGERRTAIASQPETLAFYSGVARWAAAEDMFRMYVLRLDGRPLAMYYSLQDGGVCYLLKGGFDHMFRRFSPGKLLMHDVISHGFATGLSRIEFHGDADAYKVRWANAVRDFKRFEAFSPSPAGQLARAGAVGRSAARRIVRHAEPDDAPSPSPARSTNGCLVLDRRLCGDAVGRAEFSLRHNLVGHPLLSLQALAELADALPAGAVERHEAKQPLLVPGGCPDLSGRPSETVMTLETSGRWMVLWNIEQIPAYRCLLDTILDEVAPLLPARQGGMGRREAFLFFSAPHAVTPVHFDPENNFLLQIRGTKEMCVGRFPTREWEVRELNRYYDGGHRNLEKIPPPSATFWMHPGEGVYIYPFAPHWVHNGPAASISLSITFRTDRSQRFELASLFNRRLRRYGWSPLPAGESEGMDRMKAAAAGFTAWAHRGFRRERGTRDFS